MSPEPPIPSQRSTRLHFLADGGEMGARMRTHEWDSSPLGPPSRWPQSLRTAVAILLKSKFPMFLAWGEDLTFIYNDGYIEILGGKHPWALGRRFEEIWSEIWPDVQPLVAKALAGEATFWENLPLIMNRKGFDEQAYFTFSYSPLEDESGAVRGMLCACTETTATVLAERQRLDEVERLKRLFDHSPSFMAVLRGPEHHFELLNASYMQLVGHRDLVGRTIREALPEVAGQGFFELIDDVYRSGKPYTGRGVSISLQRTRDAEAEERLLDFVYQPIADAEGRITGIFVDGYDVTERHKAELKLRESEERFRLIADSAPVPMWVTKLDRTRGFVNIAYAKFLGVPYAEALHYDWRLRIHPDDIDRLIAESLAGEATLKPFVLVGRYLRADGEWRWLRSESQPRWGIDGEHEGFIGVAHDITESRQAEAALRQLNETLEKRVEERTADLSAALDRLQTEVGERHRAEEALRQAQKMEAVGQLTGGIAHDFNNLLTPIMGGLEFIASRVEDPRLKRIASTALESSRRGAKLTGQLLTFSRIQRINMVPVAVNAVIENMRDLLRHTLGGGITVETRLEVADLHAVCDANQLENAILNLAINARDAMPEGGTLTISTRCEPLEAGPDCGSGGYVRISVADTGEGMAPEVLSRATEPFFSTKPLGKGTGLGLAQVYGIASQSGGTVRIESSPGEGTSVHIFLPAATSGDGKKGAVADADAALPQDGAATGASILIIDDDPDVRSFLGDSLEVLGHRVRTAEGGEEGIAAIAEHRPDLVLLDYAMPGMNGAEVASLLRSSHPDVPIVFVTGYAESSQLEAAVGPHVSVLRKPFALSQLAATVDENLPGQGVFKAP